MVDKIIAEGPPPSSASSSHFIKQWMQYVQHEREAKPYTSGPLSQVDLQNIYGEQIEEIYAIAQQLLTSQLPNKDYSAIILTYAQDIENMRDRVVNEEGGVNPDKWLDQAEKVTMQDAL